MELFFTAVLIGATYVSVKWKFGGNTRSGRGSRADGEAYYLQVRKEMGIDPYSPAELKQMEAEERYTQAKNEAGEAFWSGDGSYVEWREL